MLNIRKEKVKMNAKWVLPNMGKNKKKQKRAKKDNLLAFSSFRTLWEGPYCHPSTNNELTRFFLILNQLVHLNGVFDDELVDFLKVGWVAPRTIYCVIWR